MSVKQEWREGWGAVVSAALGVGMAAVVAYGLGAFMAPLTAEFGWTRAQIALAISITSIVAGVGAPFVGMVVDRLGARLVALAGTLFTCAAYATLSRLDGSLSSYWMHWGIIALGLTVTSPVVWTVAVATRFTESRGLALSIALCGTNLAGAVSPLLATILIQNFGWRQAFLGLAFYMFISAFPMAVAFFYDARDLGKRRTKSPGDVATAQARLTAGLSLLEAMRTAAFWLIAISFVFAGGAIVSLLVHLIPLLRDRGLSPMAAASAASSTSVAAVVGRVTAGYFLDRIFAPRIAAAAFTLPVVACIGLYLMPVNAIWPYISAIFFGFALGAEYNLISYLSARYFGFKAYALVYGFMFAAFCLGQAVMPPLIGWLYGLAGNYQSSLLLLGFSFLTSAGLLQFLRPYPAWRESPPEAGAKAIAKSAIAGDLAPQAQAE